MAPRIKVDRGFIWFHIVSLGFIWFHDIFIFDQGASVDGSCATCATALRSAVLGFFGPPPVQALIAGTLDDDLWIRARLAKLGGGVLLTAGFVHSWVQFMPDTTVVNWANSWASRDM